MVVRLKSGVKVLGIPSGGGPGDTHRSQGPPPSRSTENILWGEPDPANEVLRTYLPARPPFRTQGRFRCRVWRCFSPSWAPQPLPLSGFLACSVGIPVELAHGHRVP